MNEKDLESFTVVHCKDYVLQILNNLYGQKQARCVWYQYLVKGLLKLSFKQSKVDECVFYFGSSILLVYIEDSILLDPDDKELQNLSPCWLIDLKYKKKGTYVAILGSI